MVEILCDDEVPEPPGVEAYQETDWTALAMALLLLIAAGVSLILPLGLNGWTLAWWFFFPGLLAGFELLIAWLAWLSFQASRAPWGWRLRWNGEGLYLRFRSPLNHRFPADTPAVFFLPRRAVAWLRAHREQMTSPDPEGGSNPWKQGWLEVALKQVECAPIRAALAKESQLRGPKGGRHNDAPVVLVTDDLLRLKLRRPERVAALLARFYPVTLPTKTETPEFHDLSDEEKAAQVQCLARAGQSIAAIKAARDLYGIGVTEAKLMVDGLAGR